MTWLVVLLWIVIPLGLIMLSSGVGALVERHRISTRLRQLPIGQEEFEHLYFELGLHDNPFDRRSLNSE